MKEFDYEKAVNDYVRRRKRAMSLPGHRALLERPPLGVLTMQTEWWVAAGDEPVRVEDMDKDHCNNVIDFLWRRREEIFAQGWMFSIVETGEWQTNPNSWNLTMQKVGFDKLPLIAALRAQVEKLTAEGCNKVRAGVVLDPYVDTMCIRLREPCIVEHADGTRILQEYIHDGPHQQWYNRHQPLSRQVREEIDWDGMHHFGEGAGFVIWVASTNTLTGETTVTFHPEHKRRASQHFSALSQHDDRRI